MPQGPLRQILMPPPVQSGPPVQLDQTPLAQTNPGLARLVDFFGGLTGIKDALTPESSGATVAGAGIGAALPFMGALRAIKGGRSVITGLNDVRPARESLGDVVNANFLKGSVVGNKVVPLDALKGGISAGDNPQRVTNLAQQIASPNGYVERLIVDTDGNVIEGQHRLAALRQLGADQVPVTVVKDAFKNVDIAGLNGAIRASGKVHSDHVNQIAEHAVEMMQDSKTAANALADYDIPANLRPQYQAALSFLESSGKRVPQPITAYHGSPHDFDKFSLSKIGTGEGAQAYGHGLYFAENPGVAADYRRNLSAQQLGKSGEGVFTSPALPKDFEDQVRGAVSRIRVKQPGQPITQQAIVDELRTLGKTFADAKSTQLEGSAVSRNMQGRKMLATADELERGAYEVNSTVGQGRMYEVGLHASPDEFLDWDKPLSQQSEKVRKAIDELAADVPMFRAWKESGAYPHVAGEQLYRQSAVTEDVPHFMTAQKSNMAEATKRLQSKGIKGIRYLDQGSRQKTRWQVIHPQGGVNDFADEASARAFHSRNPESRIEGPDRTSNFVVFDDDIIEIKKKLALLLAAGAGTAAASQKDRK